VATVVDGVVTPIAEGTATITATTVDGGFTATCAVTVAPTPPEAVVPVSVITVTGVDGATTVVNGGTLQMSAVVAPANATNQTIAWSVATLAGGTATINPTTGLLTATGVGTVRVTATNAASGVTGTKDITVNVTLDDTAPTVTLTNPADLDTGVAINSSVHATFSEAMDPATITVLTFTVKETDSGDTVLGIVIPDGISATFDPTINLSINTEYTATITTGVKDLAGNALAADKVWSFTTRATTEAGPAPVNLGTAGNFVILAKTGISTTGVTSIVGDIGVSPAAASYITGFGLIMDASNEFSTSSLVTGKIYAADYAPPTPAKMTTAVSDMETAFTDAAGRSLPDFTELYAGDISGQTLVPGLYKWGTGVLITSAGVTLSGGANDVWIFQIAQDLTVSNSAMVTLSGGAQAKNIFWQVSGQATLGTAADFKGIILSQTLISLNTGAVMTGRALAQTAVTLIANTITAP